MAISAPGIWKQIRGRFTYDPLNRIQSETSGDKNLSYTYDANGNRLEQGSGKIFGLKEADYTFDSQNRLTQVAGEGKEVSYTYNGDGLLYERKEGTDTTRYYYDEEAKLIAEAEVSGSHVTLTYAYVYDLYGQLTARQDRATGKLQYYQFNGHGDVVGVVDEQGKQLNSYSYDIWGGPVETEETVPNVMRYAGEYWDETTGLQYLRARWYDPGTARFMGEDTYEEYSRGTNTSNKPSVAAGRTAVLTMVFEWLLQEIHLSLLHEHLLL